MRILPLYFTQMMKNHLNFDPYSTEKSKAAHKEELAGMTGQVKTIEHVKKQDQTNTLWNGKKSVNVEPDISVFQPGSQFSVLRRRS